MVHSHLRFSQLLRRLELLRELLRGLVLHSHLRFFQLLPEGHKLFITEIA